jgi:hypothetical protein
MDYNESEADSHKQNTKKFYHGSIPCTLDMITRYIFFCVNFSYASGMRKLVIAHHWAGYPKRFKERKVDDTHTD